MSLDTFLVLVDRVGVPCALLIVGAYLVLQFVRGPAMRLAELAAAPFATLCRTATTFIERAGGHLAELPGQIALEASETRGAVAAAAAATQAHVTEQVTALHARLEDAPRPPAAAASPPVDLAAAEPEPETVKAVPARVAEPPLTATLPAGAARAPSMPPNPLSAALPA